MQPVPHVPQGSAQVKFLLDQLRRQDPGSTVSRELIQQITANFDTFTEDETLWAQRGGFGACASSKASDEHAGQEFIGYTFKRKKDIVRTTLGLDKVWQQSD